MSIVFDTVTVTAEGPEGTSVLLDEVSCTLQAPRTAIIGENGSGKSTMARAISGLAQPSAGHITVDGLDTVTDVRALRRRAGFIFANPGAQTIMPTVREDVALTLRGRGLSRREVSERVEAALAAHHLTELAERSCQSLSSGQAQRLALCAVLVGEPSLILADEPTSLLDLRHSELIAARLLAPAAEQVVLVTHDLDLVRRCDEAVMVSGGRLVRQGPPDEVVTAYVDSVRG